jgi:thiopeptide-type bacteriocin biosynthesis protein
VLPATGRDDKATAFLEQAMEALTGHGAIRRWAEAIYEPEIRAFGGADAMDVAHALFHADSRYLLRHLAQARKDHRRELGLQLGSVLMRAAGQDWYEQGDIWAQVAAHRPGACQPPEPAPAGAAVVAGAVARDALGAADAYAAHDALSHATCLSHTTASRSPALAGLVRAAGLGLGTMPAEVLGNLMESVAASEALIMKALNEQTRAQQGM